MAKWLKKLLCRLTGGHTFADSNIESIHFEEIATTVILQRCTKCGKPHAYAVNDDALFGTYPMPERIEVNFDGKTYKER